MRSRKTILVLHLAGQYPLAGVVWQALQLALWPATASLTCWRTLLLWQSTQVSDSPAFAPSSVDAVQVRSIWAELYALAVRLDGSVGGVVSLLLTVFRVLSGVVVEVSPVEEFSRIIRTSLTLTYLPLL